MTIDPYFRSSDDLNLTPDTRGLLSLALDAYLAGHEHVAHDLASLASRLIEMKCPTRAQALAKEILARVSSPGQDFATLLDPFDLAEPAGDSLAGNGHTSPTENAMANLDAKAPSDDQ